MGKRQVKNRSWYTKKLATIAKKCAKERDGYICQMCGKECEGSDAHGSHVLNVGSYKYMELDPTNIKCLCSYHHLLVWHKDVLGSSEWFKETFPERAEYLDRMKKAKLKLSTVELAELYEKVRGLKPIEYAKHYIELIEKKLKEKE